MEELLNLAEGTEVDCADGVVGTLSRALVDINRKTIAHLAVEAKETGDVRLVPFDRVRAANGQVLLDCTNMDFASFACADELESVPSPLAAASGTLQERVIKRHNIPDGEAEVYKDEDVRAKNRRVGRLRGLVVNSGDGKIERLVVTVGRIFGKHDVSVPASFITAFDIEEVRLDGSTKGEVIDHSEIDAA